MGSIKDKLKQYGVDLENKTFDKSKFVPTAEELELEVLTYWRKEVDWLNVFYWDKLIPAYRLIKEPTKEDKLKLKKVYDELLAAREKLKKLEGGDKS